MENLENRNPEEDLSQDAKDFLNLISTIADLSDEERDQVLAALMRVINSGALDLQLDALISVLKKRGLYMYALLLEQRKQQLKN